MNRIKEIRESKGISQEKLAEMLETNVATVQAWEADEMLPSASMLFVLSVKLNCTENQLLGLEEGIGETLRFKNENISPPQKANISQKRNPFSLIIIIVLIIFSIAALIFVPKVIEEKNSNAFECSIKTTDLSYTYDDSNGVSVISTIIPKYDFIDFSFSIAYNCSGEYVVNEYYVGSIKAGQKIEYEKSLSLLEAETNEAFYYSYIKSISGKKQNKYQNVEEVPIYNTECEFAFSYFGIHGNDSLKMTITNNTTRPIVELREFSILINFDDVENINRYINLYARRIKFDAPLEPGQSIILNNVPGMTVKNWSTDDWWTGVTYTKYRYSEQIYQVIYK